MQTEIEKTISDIQSIREAGDLCFVALSDTRLLDSGAQTRERIQTLDRELHFDFLVHLGDILRGGSPEKVSCRILREELAAYRESLGSKKLFVTQGEDDGWRDESFVGQLVTGIMRDHVWHQETAFIDKYEQTYRQGDKPYYYGDFPEQRTRLIFLCSERYEYNGPGKLFQKYHTFGLEQLAWLKEQALQAPEGWNVLLFSHAIPDCKFETGVNPPSYKGNAMDRTFATLQSGIRERKLHHVDWVTGHYGQDCQARVVSLDYRSIGGPSVFVLKTEEHKLYQFPLFLPVEKDYNLQ